MLVRSQPSTILVGAVIVPRANLLALPPKLKCFLLATGRYCARSMSQHGSRSGPPARLPSVISAKMPQLVMVSFCVIALAGMRSPSAISRTS